MAAVRGPAVRSVRVDEVDARARPVDRGRVVVGTRGILLRQGLDRRTSQPALGMRLNQRGAAANARRRPRQRRRSLRGRRVLAVSAFSASRQAGVSSPKPAPWAIARRSSSIAASSSRPTRWSSSGVTSSVVKPGPWRVDLAVAVGQRAEARVLAGRGKVVPASAARYRAVAGRTYRSTASRMRARSASERPRDRDDRGGDRGGRSGAAPPADCPVGHDAGGGQPGVAAFGEQGDDRVGQGRVGGDLPAGARGVRACPCSEA